MFWFVAHRHLTWKSPALSGFSRKAGGMKGWAPTLPCCLKILGQALSVKTPIKVYQFAGYPKVRVLTVVGILNLPKSGRNEFVAAFDIGLLKIPTDLDESWPKRLLERPLPGQRETC